jgi:hypothetical protein
MSLSIHVPAAQDLDQTSLFANLHTLSSRPNFQLQTLDLAFTNPYPCDVEAFTPLLTVALPHPQSIRIGNSYSHTHITLNADCWLSSALARFPSLTSLVFYAADRFNRLGSACKSGILFSFGSLLGVECMENFRENVGYEFRELLFERVGLEFSRSQGAVTALIGLELEVLIYGDEVPSMDQETIALLGRSFPRLETLRMKGINISVS